jgi:hypothetical protein
MELVTDSQPPEQRVPLAEMVSLPPGTLDALLGNTLPANTLVQAAAFQSSI